MQPLRILAGHIKSKLTNTDFPQQTSKPTVAQDISHGHRLNVFALKNNKQLPLHLPPSSHSQHIPSFAQEILQYLMRSVIHFF